MRSPNEPIWRGDHEDWKRSLLSFGEPSSDLYGTLVSDHGRAVAIAVFHRAADWNSIYRAPHPYQIHLWGSIFDHDWLTIDLAERAVDQHFEAEIIGRMLPFDVLSKATYIRLEEGLV
jgi:hypothetical protein